MVQLVEKKVVVTKESSEIGDAISGLVGGVVDAKLNDGAITAPEVLSVVMDQMSALMKAMDGVAGVGAEAQEKLDEFINAWTLAGLDIKSHLLRLAQAPAAPAPAPVAEVPALDSEKESAAQPEAAAVADSDAAPAAEEHKAPEA